jgi:hypothetical protein
LTKKHISIALIAALVLGAAVAVGMYSKMKAEAEDLKAKKMEFLSLREEYLSIKSSVDAAEGRGSLTNASGIVQAIEEAFSSVGLKEKIKSVKPTGSKEITGGNEEEAEVQAEKLTMNEAVNMLYRLENMPMILTVRRADIKKSFDSPELLNITMSIALINLEAKR